MRLRVLSFVMLALLFSGVAPLMAADVSPAKPAQKPFKGFYWETKNDMMLIWGVAYSRDANGQRADNWVPIGVGIWFGGWREDFILLGNISLNLVDMNVDDTETPGVALGFTFAPVGIGLGTRGWFHYGKLRKNDGLGIYFKPTYTYLVGLNGRVVHQSSFGIQLSFAWK